MRVTITGHNWSLVKANMPEITHVQRLKFDNYPHSCPIVMALLALIPFVEKCRIKMKELEKIMKLFVSSGSVGIKKHVYTLRKAGENSIGDIGDSVSRYGGQPVYGDHVPTWRIRVPSR